MRDYPTLHLRHKKSKGTACSKKGYGCKGTCRPAAKSKKSLI